MSTWKLVQFNQETKQKNDIKLKNEKSKYCTSLKPTCACGCQNLTRASDWIIVLSSVCYKLHYISSNTTVRTIPLLNDILTRLFSFISPIYTPLSLPFQFSSIIISQFLSTKFQNSKQNPLLKILPPNSFQLRPQIRIQKYPNKPPTKTATIKIYVQ